MPLSNRLHLIPLSLALWLLTRVLQSISSRWLSISWLMMWSNRAMSCLSVHLLLTSSGLALSKIPALSSKSGYSLSLHMLRRSSMDLLVICSCRTVHEIAMPSSLVKYLRTRFLLVTRGTNSEIGTLSAYLILMTPFLMVYLSPSWSGLGLKAQEHFFLRYLASVVILTNLSSCKYSSNDHSCFCYLQPEVSPPIDLNLSFTLRAVLVLDGKLSFNSAAISFQAFPLSVWSSTRRFVSF